MLSDFLGDFFFCSEVAEFLYEDFNFLLDWLAGS